MGERECDLRVKDLGFEGSVRMCTTVETMEGE